MECLHPRMEWQNQPYLGAVNPMIVIQSRSNNIIHFYSTLCYRVFKSSQIQEIYEAHFFMIISSSSIERIFKTLISFL